MISMDEDQAIAHVQDVHHQFDGRVRNYVPILVEREAASRLAELSARAEGEHAAI